MGDCGVFHAKGESCHPCNRYHDGISGPVPCWPSADLAVESTSTEFGVLSITTGGPGYVAHGRDQWNVEALEHNEVIWTSPDGFVWSRHELNLDYPDQRWSVRDSVDG
jgi:hypothetical protein